MTRKKMMKKELFYLINCTSSTNKETSRPPPKQAKEKITITIVLPQSRRISLQEKYVLFQFTFFWKIKCMDGP